MGLGGQRKTAEPASQLQASQMDMEKAGKQNGLYIVDTNEPQGRT